jgi:hypothetical protein
MTSRNVLAPAGLTLCLLTSVVMLVLKPIPHGHRYEVAVRLSLALSALWFLYAVKPGWAIKKGVLVVACLAGLGLGIGEISVINPRSEIIQVYDSVFSAIRDGRNPYTAGTIFHYGEFAKPVYGNFNYPPMEIHPYYLAYRLAGAWNSTVLTAVFIVLHGLVCLVFLGTFPDVKRRYLVPFFPLFLFTEIIINSAMTFLVTALILLVVRKDQAEPKPVHRVLIAALFGVGLMTKFLIIPLMAGYYGSKVDWKKPATLLRSVPDAVIALAVAALIMAPYGVAAVLKETILFNLILKDRAVLTTFFPNVLSGPMTWAGLGDLYPIAALGLLAAAVLAASRLSLIPAMMTVAYTFLFVAATPEPQYIPVILYLALFGIFLKLEKTDSGILRGMPRPEAKPSTAAERS